MKRTQLVKLWSCMVHRERVACLLLEMSTDLLQLTNLLFLVNRYMTSTVNDMVHLQLPFVHCCLFCSCFDLVEDIKADCSP